jgi:hypothetical protein
MVAWDPQTVRRLVADYALVVLGCGWAQACGSNGGATVSSQRVEDGGADGTVSDAGRGQDGGDAGVYDGGISDGAISDSDVTRVAFYPDPPTATPNSPSTEAPSQAAIPMATEFTVTVNGQPCTVYDAATFRCCSFSFAGRVAVSATYNGPVRSFQINPASPGVVGTQNGSTITFTLSAPARIELQMNGAWDRQNPADQAQLLYLFADPLETDVPSPNDPTIYYFKAGYNSVRDANGEPILSVGAGDPHRGIYLAPGAVLDDAVSISDQVGTPASPFKIYGRGFLHNPFHLLPDGGVDHGRGMLTVRNSSHVLIEDIHAFDSTGHAVQLFADALAAGAMPTASKGHDITVSNVKSLHTSINSDALTLAGPVYNVTVQDSFFVSNDNLIILGGAGSSAPVGPFDNTVTGCAFIKGGHGGNWCFPQGNSPPAMGGNIGPGNLIENIDIIRTDKEQGLIALYWGTPGTIENIVFDGIRAASFNGALSSGGTPVPNMLLDLGAGGPGAKSLTLRNIDLPYPQTSNIAAGQWTVNFDNVSVNGTPVMSDADLNLTKGAGDVTTYR